MKISGFTFVHNAIAGGYPLREAIEAVKPYVDEVVVVDMESTDETRDLVCGLGKCRIVEGEWGNKAEETLGKAHALHTKCKSDTILHFEADEVWDNDLLQEVMHQVNCFYLKEAVVHRIQVEQNFQRIRWNAHKVHRLFRKGLATKDPKRGHTTVEHDHVQKVFGPECGMIWDCSYVFRDNHKTRMEQNAELWGETPQYTRRAPEHFLEPTSANHLSDFLAEPQWTWETTPLIIPSILKPLVGKVRYE